MARTPGRFYHTFKVARAVLRAAKGSDDLSPAQVAFVAKHCTIGAAKNVYALPRCKTYQLFCQRSGASSLDTKAFAKSLHAIGQRCERQTDDRTV